MDVMLGNDNGFSKVYNDLGEGTNNMNEIFRAMKEAEYNNGWNNGWDEGQYEKTMLHYQKGYLPREVAAEELSMTEGQFLEAYEEWLVSKHSTVSA